MEESLLTFTPISIEFEHCFYFHLFIFCSIFGINLSFRVQFFVIKLFLFLFHFLSKKICFTLIVSPPINIFQSILNEMAKKQHASKYTLIFFRPITIGTCKRNSAVAINAITSASISRDWVWQLCWQKPNF